MFETIPVFLYVMDLLGTFVFAITGGFRAIKYEMDIFGVFSLATAVGVGGGMTRDVLLGSVPPAALSSSVYLLTTCAAGACVFLFAPRIAPTWRKILYADAVGLGLFAAIGAAKAYLAGLGPVGVMFIATIASVGGSFIRDISTGELPLIFTRDVYASAAMLGGLVYWAVETVLPGRHISFGAAFAATVIIRIVALRWNVNLPRSRRLPASPSQIARGAGIGREAQGKGPADGTAPGNP
ncbi:MAG: trimeric intracellular cation channel family protein [Candidatus Latescibacterota bacterium]